MNKKTLFADFDSVPTKAWKQKIQVDLKGADYNDALVWDNPEGIKIKPFYNSDDFTDDHPKAPAPLSNGLSGSGSGFQKLLKLTKAL